jgi:hypothetical protein
MGQPCESHCPQTVLDEHRQSHAELTPAAFAAVVPAVRAAVAAAAAEEDFRLALRLLHAVRCVRT